MTDFSQMIRWNANFVRGLAQSVLERAKAVRGSIPPYSTSSASAMNPKSALQQEVKSKGPAKRSKKKPTKTQGKRKKRVNG